MRGTLVALLLFVSLIGGCIDSNGDNADGDDADDEVAPAVEEWDVPTDFPVQVRALPHGDVIVAALSGEIYRLSSNGTLLGTVKHIDVQGFTGEYGLLGMAVHPDYPQAPWIYVFYTLPAPAQAPTGGALEQAIARFELPQNSTEGGALETLVQLPASPACCHNGGRLGFGHDGYLYATLGDQMVGARAQIPTDPAGSILRYTDDGGIPDDNPYPASPVVVTGMRNAFGLHIDAELGIIATDNGPSTIDGPPGYDQIFVLQPGDDGGWPIAYGDDTYPGRTDPIWHSGETPIAPTGVHVPRDSLMTQWNDKILFCNWNTDEAMLLDPHVADAEPEVVFDQCRFDVTQDPSGRVLIAGEGTIWVHSSH